MGKPIVRTGGRKGAGLSRTSWSGVARGRGSHGDAKSFPLLSIASHPLRHLWASVSYRGSDPTRHVEVHEILYFSGTTRDVVLDTTKSKTTYDVAVTLRPVSKMANNCSDRVLDPSTWFTC